MKCRAVQRELSSVTDVGAEVRRHLEGCDGCRQFAQDVQSLRTMADLSATTPTALREQTLDRCRLMLVAEASGGRVSPGQRLRRFFSSPRFVAASATLGMLVFVGLTIMQIHDAQDRETSLLMKVSIIQIALQNFVAALFLPALLVLKNRAGKRTGHVAALGE